MAGSNGREEANSEIEVDNVEAQEAGDVVDDIEEPEHIHEVIRKASAGLFIGDFVASQDFEMLRELGISVVVAAMRQRYDVPDDIDLHRVPIDDDSRTNVMTHFPRVNDIIHDSLEAGKGVLVHCQAGVSRSATLCAAFLMHEYGLTADEAIERISAVRSVIEPTEFFMHQLEMYERMECEVDAAKYVEYRRFLMAFSHADFMEGDGEHARLYLAYYPSPAPTPRARSPSDPFRSLHMTPVDGKNGFVPRRRSSSSSSRKSFGAFHDLRMTSTNEPKQRRASATARDISQNFRRPSRAELDAWSQERRPSEVRRETLAKERENLKQEGLRVAEGKERLLNIGRGRVKVKGRRLRCKMCNRELAAREHIVDHDPGSGQQAFAIHRRDMTQHRIDEQKRKEDAKRRADRRAEQATAKGVPSGPVSPKEASSDTSEKRKSLQDRLPNVAGLRVAMPPPFRPPVDAIRPSPSAEDSSAIDLAETPEAEAEPSPPLLASTTCSSYFTEPLSWMQGLLETGELGGRILCPNDKCGAKLGSFDWAGVQCSCGAWVVPGFALHTSKVDEIAS